MDELIYSDNTDSTHPESERQALKPTKSRGSVSNPGSRYINTTVEAADDGWGNDSAPVVHDEDRPAAVKTRVYEDRTKRLITTNRSPDIPFDQSINPYKGCEHGCIYCFARPTHAYLDLSPGLDFETRIFCKTNPREHLLRELGRPGYRCSVIAMGTNTDPYQPIEKQREVTRTVLATLLELKHPVSIVTKSKLILRDIDLLAEMASLGLVHVNVSVTTLSNALKTKLEPRTASPAARLRTITQLRSAGVPTGAMLAPIIPFINDHEIEDLVARSVDAGAQVLRYILLRLPLEVKPLFEEWLAVHYPLKAERVMAAVRDTRGGKAYRAQWHKRMVGQGAIAELIKHRFVKASRKHGVLDAAFSPSNTDLFVAPEPRAKSRRAVNKNQMQLFPG